MSLLKGHSQFLHCVVLLVISVSAVLATTEFDKFFYGTLFKAWQADLNDYSEIDQSARASYPTVRTKNGTIRGQLRYSGSTKIYRYLGIPYAKPPINELRFQPPQPYEGWGDRIYNATSNPNACAQVLLNLTTASEDCLYLNVFTRRNGNSDDGKLLPVIYWIHGGGYVFGQNSYYTGMKLLKDEEIVLVTVQYRLGPLGFFATGDNTVSANNGMKDMVQGLRWVQENIEAFGGDPNQVTVMGESAGSASALYMLISPLARGLFHRVVGMSGSPLQEWAIDRNPALTAKRLGQFLNCSTDSSQAILDCMKQQKWGAIIEAEIKLILEDFKNFKINLAGTTPVIEGNVPGAFLPDDPLKLLKEGPLPDVEVLLGTVQTEGILPLAVAYFLTLDPEGRLNDTDYMKDYFLGDMLTTYNIDDRKDGASISQALTQAFMPPDADITNFESYMYELMDAVSVVFMKAPVLRTASILSRRLPAVYLYSFEYFGKNSLYHIAFVGVELIMGGRKPPMRPGICHADDLIYMFRLPFFLTPKDQTFSKNYVKLFTNFVVHGNPTPQPTHILPAWPKYDDVGKGYMRMADKFEAKRDYSKSWMQGTTEWD